MNIKQDILPSTLRVFGVIDVIIGVLTASYWNCCVIDDVSEFCLTIISTNLSVLVGFVNRKLSKV